MSVDIFTDGIKERLADPFWSRYAFIFFVFNWKVWVAMFGSESTEKKIPSIMSYASNHFGFVDTTTGYVIAFVVPGVFAFFYILLWGHIQRFFEVLLREHKIRTENALIDTDAKKRSVALDITDLKDKLEKLTKESELNAKKGIILDHLSILIHNSQDLGDALHAIDNSVNNLQTVFSVIQSQSPYTRAKFDAHKRFADKINSAKK